MVPCPFFCAAIGSETYSCSCVRVLLEQYAAVRSSTRTETTSVRELLESSVARVLPNAAAAAAADVAASAAAECSCARDCLATRRENTLHPPRTYPVDCFFGISVRFTIYLLFVPRIALRGIPSTSRWSSAQQQNTSNNRRTNAARVECCYSAGGCCCSFY